MKTPDDSPGVRAEEGVIFDDEAISASQEGELRFASGSFSLFDETGEFNPRDVDPALHAGIDSLVHALAEDSFEELTFSGSKVTNSTVWTDIGKTVKIRETLISYSGNKITQTIDIQYDEAGIEVERLTQVLTYNGNKIKTITSTRVP